MNNHKTYMRYYLQQKILINNFLMEKTRITINSIWKRKLIQRRLLVDNQNSKNLSEIDYHKKNYSAEIFEQQHKDLIQQIAYDRVIIEFLKFLVLLTSIDERFFQCGSDSINLLVKMKVNLREQTLENIRIRDTNLIGGNFAKCNLNGQEFHNVDISGINLNQAQLFNSIQIRWPQLKQYSSLKCPYYIIILKMSYNPNLDAQGALILKREFVDQKGYDLLSLFKSKKVVLFQRMVQNNLISKKVFKLQNFMDENNYFAQFNMPIIYQILFLSIIIVLIIYIQIIRERFLLI
ncbi:unnamed protein product [Paramecium octaurelia]|uniref:Pentapeptide repeat-containing protein n=1 Tax=Paramecium octaurelia TaxID=43137 RepID=A0A8S1SCA9_PAROT|nr:unnamed protein product [Paramecium octaurelia]